MAGDSMELSGGGDQLWHMPRRGAPHAHGPGSAAAVLAEDPETAKTESSCETFVLSHFLHVTFADDALTTRSNFVPHSRHSYSKMGIGGLALM